MNRARIVVLAIAIGAGGIAANLASGSDNKPPPAEPVVQLPRVDVLVAKSDVGLGQTVKPNDLQWQTWPTAIASSSLNLRVVAIDQAPKEKDGPTAVAGKTITLELKPEQIATLPSARQVGSLSLALRSIADIKMVEGTVEADGAKASISSASAFPARQRSDDEDLR